MDELWRLLYCCGLRCKLFFVECSVVADTGTKSMCVCSACPLVRGPTLILTGYCTIIYYNLRRVDRCEKQKQEEKYRGN